MARTRAPPHVDTSGTPAARCAAPEGSTFTATIPLPLAPAEAPSAPEALASDNLPKGLHILGADDNQVNRMVLSAYLGALGVQATIAAGGAEAVTARDGADYDGLMLDISMPGMDGIETLAALRAHEAAKPNLNSVL